MFDAMREMLMQKPVHLKGPTFYKADSDAKKQLTLLEQRHVTASEHQKAHIERDIKLLSYGISGEENVAFELKNSYLPIIVLHDLRLEYEGLSAQIDYLLITPKLCLVVECKNLFGNITINNKGEFIRELSYNGRRHKEGIYSPVTQNSRHMEMIKRIGADNKSNVLLRKAFEKYFAENYRSVIVLANPKTIINTKYAPKVIKDQIIRSDQLITHIKKLNKESKNLALSEKDMYKQAEFFMRYHKENPVDYTQKYALDPEEANILVEDTAIFKELKRYRNETSQAEGIKVFQVFTNAQLIEVIAAMPTSLGELKKVSGFGEVRVAKYGEAILKIVEKCRQV